MYQLNDTIVAVSSPTVGNHVIIRVTGEGALEKAGFFFQPAPDIKKPGIYHGLLKLDQQLAVNAQLYLFIAPHSYTAEDMIELHFCSNGFLTEFVIEKFLCCGLRSAEPGEFTARAYLNSKISLEQAEAVNEVITGSNRFQLAAAQNLLAGKLGDNIRKIKAEIAQILAHIEAGLDFSTEDVTFIDAGEAKNQIERIIERIQNILNTSIAAETIIDLPDIGIAGAPNAGKSSLINKMLEKKRSIVSHQRKTTRDILSAKITLKHSQAVIFDCAGLIANPKNILDLLAQRAATDALKSALVTIFCVDLQKNDWNEDIEIRKLIKSKNVISLATKSDLLTEPLVSKKIEKLNSLFQVNFLPISTRTSHNIIVLKKMLDNMILNVTVTDMASRRIALTARHKQALTDAAESLNQALINITAASEEIAAMMLRAAYFSLGNIETEDLNEEVLGKIFSRFCIGK